jgi:hypothetical protein
VTRRHPHSSWPATEPATHQAHLRAEESFAPADAVAMGGRVEPGHDKSGWASLEGKR